MQVILQNISKNETELERFWQQTEPTRAQLYKALC